MSGRVTIEKCKGRRTAIDRGEACQGCGIYFKRAHGHKVWCRHCWDRLSYNKKILKKNKISNIPTLGE